MGKRDLEGPVQRSVISWLRVVLPDALIHHSPNETRRPGRAGDVERAMNRANGTLAGYPDIWGYCDLGEFFLEVKAEGGRLSEAQREFRDRYIRLGGQRYAVVRSIEDAREALFNWGIQTQEAGSLVRLPVMGVVR